MKSMNISHLNFLIVIAFFFSLDSKADKPEAYVSASILNNTDHNLIVKSYDNEEFSQTIKSGSYDFVHFDAPEHPVSESALPIRLTISVEGSKSKDLTPIFTEKFGTRSHGGNYVVQQSRYGNYIYIQKVIDVQKVANKTNKYDL